MPEPASGGALGSRSRCSGRLGGCGRWKSLRGARLALRQRRAPARTHRLAAWGVVLGCLKGRERSLSPGRADRDGATPRAFARVRGAAARCGERFGPRRWPPERWRDGAGGVRGLLVGVECDSEEVERLLGARENDAEGLGGLRFAVACDPRAGRPLGRGSRRWGVRRGRGRTPPPSLSSRSILRRGAAAAPGRS